MRSDDPEQQADEEEAAAEHLLSELGRLERHEAAQDAIDPAWRALCEGRLAPSEIDALEHRTPDAEQPILAAFKPLSNSLRDDMVQKLMAERSVKKTVGSSSQDDGNSPRGDVAVGDTAIKDTAIVAEIEDQDARAPSLGEEPVAEPLSFTPPSTSTSRRFVLGLLAAMLAVAVGWIAIGSLRDTVQDAPSFNSLPDYSIEWRGAVSQRSGNAPPSDVPRWSPGTEIRLILRPLERVTSPVFAFPFLEYQDEVTPWPGNPPKVADSGSVQLRGSLESNGVLESGSCTIWILLGTTPTAPTLQEVQELIRSGRTLSSPTWKVLSRQIEIVDGPS